MDKIHQIDIELSALSPPISQQLDAANINYNAVVINHLQKDAEAITRLSIRGFITSDITHRARKRLIKKLSIHLKEGA